ncbi:hypothetical protein IAS59_000771 [Cryptococcus gattii]
MLLFFHNSALMRRPACRVNLLHLWRTEASSLAGPDRLVDQARATSSTSPFIFNSIIICLHLGRLSGRPQTSRQKRLQAAVSVIYNDLPICAPFEVGPLSSQIAGYLFSHLHLI